MFNICLRLIKKNVILCSPCFETQFYDVECTRLTESCTRVFGLRLSCIYLYIYTRDRNIHIIDVFALGKSYPNRLGVKMANFESLGLSEWLVNQCKQMGITRPTPVQEHCMPAILEGRFCVLFCFLFFSRHH